MHSVPVAPHLWRALEVMAQDMAMEPAALVNQAVFAWLRINGYVVPGTVRQAAAVIDGTGAPLPGVAAPGGVLPVPAMPVAATPVAATPVAAAPVAAAPVAAAPVAAAPVAAAPVAAAPVAAAPAAAPGSGAGGDVVAAPTEARDSSVDALRAGQLERMQAIEAALAEAGRPWPAFAAPADEGDEGDEGDEADEGADAGETPDEPDEDTGVEARGIVEGEGGAQEMGGDTGETEVMPPEEGTQVVRSSPVVLYLEREGEAPVAVLGDRFVIGRGPTCNLIIEAPRVSREHAAIVRSGARYVLEDLGSSNGTWFGEERVTTREIDDGDAFVLGSETVVFVLRAE